MLAGIVSICVCGSEGWPALERPHVKIVVIGAGSRSFGWRTVNDVLGTPALQAFKPELVLVDIDTPKLDDMLALAGRVKGHFNSTVTVRGTSDREEALKGADYVMISVTQRRYELWEQDYRVPRAHGFAQAYAENGGPGALFHAMRNLHLILPMVRDVERICPDAILFNYSNPESRVLLAILTLTKVRAIGLCHGQHDVRRWICKALQIQEEDLETVGAGINHFFWLYKIANRTTGEDLYPAVRRAAEADASPHFALPRKLLEIYGMLTYPDNTHTGEFVPFCDEFMHAKWPHGLESRKVGDLHRSQIDRLAPYLRKEKPIEEIARLSTEMGVPMLLAHAAGTRTPFIAGNVLNAGLYIPNLLPDGVVEVPVEVDGAGFHPQPVPPLPDGVAAFCRTQMAIQKLTVRAYDERSKNLLLQALLLEPVVHNISEAEALIEEMLALQADYLPTFQ